MEGTDTTAYGWKNADPTAAHSYITSAVFRLVEERDVRSILDLGCGNGALANQLAAAGYDVVGADADGEGVRLANEEGAAEFHHFSVYDDPADFPRHDFDLVLSSEVVEHLYKPTALPAFAASVLRDRGYLLMTTPYHGYLKNLALSATGAWDKHLNPFWDGGHIKFWSRPTLEKLVQDAGFDPVHFEGLGRAPYLWKSMLLLAQLRS